MNISCIFISRVFTVYSESVNFPKCTKLEDNCSLSLLFTYNTMKYIPIYFIFITKTIT